MRFSSTFLLSLIFVIFSLPAQAQFLAAPEARVVPWELETAQFQNRSPQSEVKSTRQTTRRTEKFVDGKNCPANWLNDLRKQTQRPIGEALSGNFSVGTLLSPVLPSLAGKGPDVCTLRTGRITFNEVNHLDRILPTELSRPARATDNLIEVSEDIIFQTLAGNSHKQAQCRNTYFNEYLHSEKSRGEANKVAQQIIERHKDNLQTLLAERARLAKEQEEWKVVANGLAGRGGSDQRKMAQSFGKLVAEKNKAIAELLMPFPMSYDPDVRQALEEMAKNGQFEERVLLDGMQKAQIKYAQTENYYWSKAEGLREGPKNYCLGISYRNQAGRSGELSRLLQTIPDKNYRNKLSCHLRARYETGPQRFNLGIALVSVAALIPSGGTSAAGLAVAGTAELVMAIDAITAECSGENFMISGDRALCDPKNPRESFQKTLVAFSKSRCGVALGASALGIASVGALAAAPQLAKLTKTNQVDEIVVVANRPSVKFTDGSRKHVQDHILSKGDEKFIDELVSSSKGRKLNAADAKRVREDGSPFRRRLTSLYPEGVTPDEVVSSFMLQRKNLKPVVERNADKETFVFEHKGDRYRIVICRAQTCEGSSQVAKNGDIVSVYPYCGPQVRNLVNRHTAVQLLTTNRNVSRGSLIRAAPCEEVPSTSESVLARNLAGNREQHSLETVNNQTVLNIGFMWRDGLMKHGREMRDAIRAGSIDRINTGRIIGPKVLPMVLKLKGVAPASKNMKIEGRVSVPEIMLQRDFEVVRYRKAQQEGKSVDMSTRWPPSEVNSFDNAMRELGVVKACRDFFGSLKNCGSMRFEFDANTGAVRWEKADD